MDLVGGGSHGLLHEVRIVGDGSVVVSLDGELDISTTEALDASVRAVLGSVSTSLVIDATELRFADSSGFALWVGWSRDVPRLEVQNPSPLVRRVVQAMGLAEIFHVT
jgi:anti-anti-sigma factor